MIDPRLYRAALIPVVGALVMLMFSLQPVPNPIPKPISTPDFEGREAARLARTIATLAPNREPGTEGERAVADLVRERFAAIEGGEVAIQPYAGSFEGDPVALQNVVLTLPAMSEEVILIVAGRDSHSGFGATTSAASTAALVTLAEDLGDSRRNRTFVIASIADSSDGYGGVDRLVEELDAPEGITAAIALEAMGVERVGGPVVVTPKPGGGSVPIRLIETARALAEPLFAEDAVPPGGLAQLSRLAMPIGLGAGAALTEAGIDGIAISGSGERPPPIDEDGLGRISSETLAATGTLAVDLALTLDEAARAPAETGGPSSYVKIGDNLIPGWALVVIGAALILPGLLVAADGWLRERRAPGPAAGRIGPWVGERILLALAPVALLYLLVLSGLLPDPEFPFNPDRFTVGGRGLAVIGALALIVAVATVLVRPMRTPLDATPPQLATGAGLAIGVSLAGIWVLEPLLALLLAPLAHVWLLAARPTGGVRTATVLAGVGLALIPWLAAATAAGSQLDLGFALPWHLLLLVASGEISPLLVLLASTLAGGLVALVAATRADSILPPGAGTPRPRIAPPSLERPRSRRRRTRSLGTSP